MDLGGGRPSLRREGTGLLDPNAGHSEPLQPPPRHHQAGGRQPELVAPDPRCGGSGGRTQPKKNEMNEKDVNETCLHLVFLGSRNGRMPAPSLSTWVQLHRAWYLSAITRHPSSSCTSSSPLSLP